MTEFFHNFISFILVLSIIVFIHEFGHYYIAKINNIKIDVFSIGFGKEIVGWTDKSGTRWKISMLPFGGYVKMFGDYGPASIIDAEKAANMTEEEKKQSFHHKPLSVKALVVAAGPAANFLLAIVIIASFFVISGKEYTPPIVEIIQEDSPALKAGFKVNDKILQIDETDIKSFKDIERAVNDSKLHKLKFLIQRNDEDVVIEVMPNVKIVKDMFDNEVEKKLVGIGSTNIEYEKLGILEAVRLATYETYFISKMTLKGIGEMIIGTRSSEDVGGAIRIAKYSGMVVKYGVKSFFWFIAILSINLGIINLFPISMLDGGHLFFYAIEAVFGKEISVKIQKYSLRIGIILILSLTIFTFINDIRYLLK